MTTRTTRPADVHHLRRGVHYHATTRHDAASGEYIGMESPFGDRSILLRGSEGTASIELEELVSIHRVA
jgi:hypothetical protein